MPNSLLESLEEKYVDKKVLVVGLGIQGGGIGVAKFFAELGARVHVTDLKTREELNESLLQLQQYSITYTLGVHNIEDFLHADLIIKGPSVPWQLPEIERARSQGIPIEMEVSLFASLTPSILIGVTGTRGKSTTTALIERVMKANGLSVFLGGNIPHISTIHLLKQTTEKDFVVLELSSWQLSGFHSKKISPHISVFTNIYPDHLNYYKKLSIYLQDKKAIYLYQAEGDYLVINRQIEPSVKGEKIKSHVRFFSGSDFPEDLKYMRGAHNKENAAAALLVSDILKLNRSISMKTITQFQGLPYREETVATIQNVEFINDTTSTTPIATIKAIETFLNKEITLILGGDSKGLPTKELLQKLKFVKQIVLLKGSFTQEIWPIVNKKYGEKLHKHIYENLEGAVSDAFILAKKNNAKSAVVLFSPGATSFSLFKNEFHRGEEFTKAVKKLVE